MVRKFFGCICGIAIRPRETIDELAQLISIRPAVMLVLLVQMLGWLNLLLYIILGQDWPGYTPRIS